MKQARTQCPVTKAAQLLSDTWTMRINHALLDAPKRYCEIERELEGISTRTLTLKLKKLEEEGIVRKGTDLYALTSKGKGLRIIEAAMKRYGEKYL
jgi:DNA-binding HxlR family transcriptional regulator